MGGLGHEWAKMGASHHCPLGASARLFEESRGLMCAVYRPRALLTRATFARTKWRIETASCDGEAVLCPTKADCDTGVVQAAHARAR